MRTTTLIAALLFVSACGGGAAPTDSTPNNPPPPPPPPALVPAVIAVTAGDGQTGDPGVNVAIKPVVTIRDASGVVVPGVSVSFTVDSGGGTVQTALVTTASDGTASPGDWRLGATETRNVLRATAGTLPPAKIVASAVFSARILADSTLSDGRLEVRSGGLQGARLDIAAGSFSGAQNWTLKQEPTSAWAARSGVIVAPLALRITSSASGISNKPLMLTLPVAPLAGHRAFVMMRNPVTGAAIVLNTVEQSATTITAAANHLDGAFVAGAAPVVSGLRRAFSVVAAGYDAVVVVSQIALTDLNKDEDTGFLPGVDDWDFRSWPTQLEGGTTLIDFGKTMSSIVYFAHLRSRGALYNKYRLDAAHELSNRQGIRAAAYMNHLVPDDQMLAGVTTIRNATLAGQADQLFFYVLKANLFVTKLPQLLLVALPTTDPDEATVRIKALTVYKTVGSKIYFADPNRPGDATPFAEFTNGAFAPLTIPIGPSGTTMTGTFVAAVGAGTWFKTDRLAADVATVLDGGWPVEQADALSKFADYTVRVRTGHLEDTTLYAADTTRMWIACPTCTGGYASSTLPGLLQPFAVYRPGSTNVFDAGTDQGMLWDLKDPANDTFGMAVFTRYQQSKALWLDWKTLVVKKWVLDVTPASATGNVNDDVSFSIVTRGPTAPPHRFVWNFGDQTATVNSAPGDVTKHAYRQEGTFPIKVEMRRLSDNTLLGMGTASAEITAKVPYWRITSFMPDPNEVAEDRQGLPFSALLDRVIAVPASGLIAIDTVPPGNGSRIALRVRTTSTFANVTCCPPPMQGTELEQELGRTPASQYALGPFFTLYRNNVWTQSTNNLDAGTMTASRIDGTHTYGIQGGGSQLGPTYAWRLSEVVRNGLTMTGKISFFWWGFNDQGVIETEAHETWFRFTATRLR